MTSTSAHKRIQRLAPAIAERIAAGEVIERPASVVKELIENSLDAGATEVSVSLEQGGKSLIEILDNGLGMPPEDLELSIERHATSKLSTLEDLDSILTLGFRGEALSSIAAVTDLQLISRAQGAESAFELVAGDLADRLGSPGGNSNSPKSQKITFGHFIDAPHGTRIQARGLFAQIPARLKFLKSQGAEVSQVREWMERIAIAHPQVGFHLLSEGRTILRLPPATEAQRVQAVLADGDDYPLMSHSNTQDGFRDLGLKIRIHWLQGLSSPQNRKLIQIVNGRAVRDRMLQQAVLSPFRQLLLPGQFPAVALLIDVNPAAIDVNVHPTKTEIRFLDSRKIFSAIDEVIRSLVSQNGAPAQARSFGFGGAPQNPFAPTGASSGTSVGGGTWPGSSVPSPSAPSWGTAHLSQSSAFHPQQSAPPSLESSLPTHLWKASESHVNYSREMSHVPGNENRSETSPETPKDTQSVFSSDLISEKAFYSKADLAPKYNPLSTARYVGAIFHTYLLFESSENGVPTLILVDQHAAHERIQYEKLKNRVLRAGQIVGTADSATETPGAVSRDTPLRSSLAPLSSQGLLLPEVVKFSVECYALLKERIQWLSQLGFDTEFFGEDSLVFRSVPIEWGTRHLRVRLKNLVDRVLSFEPQSSSRSHTDSVAHSSLSALTSTNRAPDAQELGALFMDEALFEALAREACHSAIRAGDSLENSESLELSKLLFECENPWNCPHGRPTIVKVPQGKLEEWFFRRV